jgi:hypothetical protein
MKLPITNARLHALKGEISRFSFDGSVPESTKALCFSIQYNIVLRNSSKSEAYSKFHILSHFTSLSEVLLDSVQLATLVGCPRQLIQ